METIADVVDTRLRIIHQENKGKPSAMNAALEQIRGEFYAVHDADDLSDARRIESQVNMMQGNPDLAAVFCGYDLIIGNRRLAPLSVAKDREACERDIAAFRMPSHDPTGMYRMSLVGEERYNPKLLLGEGFDYILRIGEKHPMAVIGECLYSYRIHQGSVTKRNIEKRVELVSEVLHAVCLRRGLSFEKQFPQCQKTSLKRRFKDVDNNLAAHFMESAYILAGTGKRWAAVKVGFFCSCLHPLDFHYYKALIYAITPAWLVRRIRTPRV
jgi:glycosyltransferase involved in cell wall biosynthesis